MPKQKTHKGTKKRFRLTASGKAKHRSAGTSHLAARMSSKRRRQLRGTDVAATVESMLDARCWMLAMLLRSTSIKKPAFSIKTSNPAGRGTASVVEAAWA